MHQNRSRVHVGLVQVHGRYFVTCCLKPSWNPGVIFLSFQPLDDHNPFVRTVYRLYDKGLSSKTVWQKLIRNWAFDLVKKKKVSTKTLRRFIPGNCRLDSNKCSVSSVTTFHGMSFRQLTGKGSYLIIFFTKISSWTKLPLSETSLRAPLKSSKQTTGG